MGERDDRSMDEVLAQAFASGPDQTADDGFSASVVGRIRRRQRFRRLLLGTAALLGALVALEPAMTLIGAVGLDAEALASQLAGVSVSPAYAQAATAGAVGLLALLFTRALEG